MPKITVNEDICKGCGLCTANCPKKIVRLAKDRLNKKGYHPAECFEPEACIGCTMSLPVAKQPDNADKCRPSPHGLPGTRKSGSPALFTGD